MTRLTDTFIRGIQPPEKTTYFKDGDVREFGLRVTKNGVKSFTVLLGSGTRHTIGRYPQISLHRAREEAKRLLAERVLGKRHRGAIGLLDAKARFLVDCKQHLRPSTLYGYELMLRLHVPFANQRLDTIKPQQIIAHLNTLSPSNREHATRVGKTFFRWCKRHHLLEDSPMERLQASKGPSRERVLSDEELALVYQAAKEGADSYSRLVTFLIRSGARRGEASLLQRSWIDEDEMLIVFPSSITKNRRVHTLPYLSSWALADGDDGLVFKGRTDTPIAGWSKLKRAFDEKHTVREYTLHDLRRTVSSGLARLGVPIHVAEKILNHVSGTHSGVQAVYNRYSYLEEMREALTRWEAHLASLVDVRT